MFKLNIQLAPKGKYDIAFSNSFVYQVGLGSFPLIFCNIVLDLEANSPL